MNQSEKFELLRAASEVTHGAIGAWMFDQWASINDHYFGGALETIALVWALTPHGSALGFFDGGIPRITLHPSLIDPRSADLWGMGRILGERQASDVLLHEMIHQAIFQAHGNSGKDEGTSSHNNAYWVSEVNRISSLLGLNVKAQVVRQRRVVISTYLDDNGKERRITKPRWVANEGFLELSELSSFPQSCRPEKYYERG